MRTGLRIRDATAADSSGIARVHVDAWRSTYAGIVPQGVLAALSYAHREANWLRLLDALPSGHCVFVAENVGDRIVGFSHGGPLRAGPSTYAGELYAIYILDAYQRRGLGRALALQVVRRFLRQNVRSMLVWVLADNPARRFYEALGAQLVQTQKITIGGAPLDEVAYGWPDISRIEQGQHPAGDT